MRQPELVVTPTIYSRPYGPYPTRHSQKYKRRHDTARLGTARHSRTAVHLSPRTAVHS
jgi:hypothetical protein